MAREHLGRDGAVDPSARLVEDLGLDSIQLLTLAAEVENRFRVALDAGGDSALPAVATVGDLADEIARRLGR